MKFYHKTGALRFCKPKKLSLLKNYKYLKTSRCTSILHISDLTKKIMN